MVLLLSSSFVMYSNIDIGQRMTNVRHRIFVKCLSLKKLNMSSSNLEILSQTHLEWLYYIYIHRAFSLQLIQKWKDPDLKRQERLHTLNENNNNNIDMFAHIRFSRIHLLYIRLHMDNIRQCDLCIKVENFVHLSIFYSTKPTMLYVYIVCMFNIAISSALQFIHSGDIHLSK